MSKRKNELSKYQLLNSKTANTYEKEGTSTASASSGVSLEDYGSGRMSVAEERRDAETAAIGKQYDTQQSLADEQQRAALRQQAQQRADSKREAYIAHERLQKYLPQAQAAAGTEGMGMSETAKINSLNAYLGQRSAADAAYATGVADLEAAKKAADTERSLARQQAEQAILQDYLDTKEAIEAEKSAAVGTMVESKANSYAGTDGKLSPEDYRKLSDYVDQHRGMMTADDQILMDLTLEGYRDQVRTDAEQMAVDKSEFATKGVTLSGGTTLGRGISVFNDGNNFTVKDANGAEYKVELDAKDGAVTDAAIVEAAKQTKKGDIFAYGNKLYLNNGTEVYGIRSRGGNAESDWTALYQLFFEGGPGKATESENKVQTLAAYGNGSTNEQVVNLNGTLYILGADGALRPVTQ